MKTTASPKCPANDCRPREIGPETIEMDISSVTKKREKYIKYTSEIVITLGKMPARMAQLLLCKYFKKIFPIQMNQQPALLGRSMNSNFQKQKEYEELYQHRFAGSRFNDRFYLVR